MIFPLIIEPDGGQPRVFSRRFTIGKLGDLALAGDPYVSSLHTACTPYQGGWYVEDLGSANGTWLTPADDGDPVRVRGPYELGRGDRLRIGRTTMIVVPA